MSLLRFKIVRWCECVSPRSREYQAILLTRQAHSGGVNDGHEPVDVWRYHPVEELLVAVLEPHQKHISGSDREEQGGKHSMLIFNILRTHTCWGGSLLESDVKSCVFVSEIHRARMEELDGNTRRGICQRREWGKGQEYESMSIWMLCYSQIQKAKTRTLHTCPVITCEDLFCSCCKWLEKHTE